MGAPGILHISKNVMVAIEDRVKRGRGRVTHIAGSSGGTNVTVIGIMPAHNRIADSGDTGKGIERPCYCRQAKLIGHGVLAGRPPWRGGSKAPGVVGNFLGGHGPSGKDGRCPHKQRLPSPRVDSFVSRQEAVAPKLGK